MQKCDIKRWEAIKGVIPVGLDVQTKVPDYSFARHCSLSRR